MRDKIIKFCEEYLEVDKFKDHCHNGLQVEGREKVKKIITGVTFSEKLAKIAIEKKADMIMVHHGIFSQHFDRVPRFIGYMKNRLNILFQNDINLAGFHLPLDAHAEIGNNISLVKELGMKKVGIINSPEYGDIGFIGEFENEMNLKDFVELVDEKLETKSYVIDGGAKVKKVGVISGGANNDWKTVQAMGADTFLTGAVDEHNVSEVEESNFNFINAGHYNTEKLGIINLGKLVSEKFDVDVEFVDVPCDI